MLFGGRTRKHGQAHLGPAGQVHNPLGSSLHFRPDLQLVLVADGVNKQMIVERRTEQTRSGSVSR